MNQLIVSRVPGEEGGADLGAERAIRQSFASRMRRRRLIPLAGLEGAENRTGSPVRSTGGTMLFRSAEGLVESTDRIGAGSRQGACL